MPQIQIFPEQVDVQKQMNNQIMGTLGQGLGNFVAHRNANKALEKVLTDPTLKDSPVSDRLDALTRALSPYGEVGQGILAARLGVEQQAKQEKEANSLARIQQKIQNKQDISEKDFEGVSPENIMKQSERLRSVRVGKGVGDTLRSIPGFPEELAQQHEDLIANTEKGTGQTHAIESALRDAERYRQYGPQAFAGGQNQAKDTREVASKLNPDVVFEPLPSESVPLTPDQRIEKAEKLRKENEERYTKLSDKVRSDKQVELDTERLIKLNESKNIREGYLRYLDIDEEGNLKYPENATADEAEYAKIIARMSGGAKNDFPGRVTNFDLRSFINRLPNLRNTKEGRRQIAEGMRIMNKIQSVYAQALKEVYDHYGADKINYQQADKEAEKIAGPLVEKLAEEYKNIDFKMDVLSAKDKAKDYPNLVIVQTPEGKVAAWPKTKPLPKGAKPL